MFLPYLRGKQHELLSIERTAAVIAKSNKIIPIVEPVSMRGLEKTVEVVTAAGAPVVVLTNPSVGDLIGSPKPITDLLTKFSAATPGLLVKAGTTEKNVKTFLSTYPTRDICVVHVGATKEETNIAKALNGHKPHVKHVFSDVSTSQAYRTLFSSTHKSGLLNRFDRKARNADYPEDEFFTDSHLTFTQQGQAGFADYSIVGDEFAIGGGAAHAVAIHFPYRRKNGQVWIKHFVSDRTTGPSDPGGKFLEALAKLETHAQQDAFSSKTAACQEFLLLHAKSHYPGLGVVKQLSIRHHIELMAKIL